MSDIPEGLYYTEDHEWARVDEDDDRVVWVGVTDYAQSKLGDIVMVELPDVGDATSAGDAFGTVESPKSVSDLFAPLDGEIIEVNEALEDAPELVNEDCYGDGWLVKLRLDDDADLDALMDAAAYKAHLDTAEDD